MAIKPVPDGYNTVTPYLVVDDAVKVLAFVEKAFGGRVRSRMDGPDGSVAHAEVQLGDSVIMVADATDEWRTGPTMIHLYMDDCDGVYRRALEAGAESLREPEDQFYGDRSAGVKDPSGTSWWIATRVEDVPPEEMARRAARAAQQS